MASEVTRACKEASGGFTLIEVLIAATIFFASIVVISESYRLSVESYRRSAAIVRMLTPMPMLVSRVENLLRENPAPQLQEEGLILGVSYRWVANVAESFSPPDRIDPDTDEFRSYRQRFNLYDVSITLRVGDQEKKFSYRELAWLPLSADNDPAASR